MIKQLTKTGKYHIENNGEDEDALCYAQNQDFCVISLADGVSTCSEAKAGAEIASRTITNFLINKGEYLFRLNEKQIAKFIVARILFEIKWRALKENKNYKDYSSTVASVLVDKRKNRLFCFSLGDSIILSTEDEKCCVVTMPSNSSLGCYVTTTKDASSFAKVKMLDISNTNSIIICSDGAWKQMYNRGDMKPEVYNIFLNNELDELEDFFSKQNCLDDYSFISLDMQKFKRREIA